MVDQIENLLHFLIADKATILILCLLLVEIFFYFLFIHNNNQVSDITKFRSPFLYISMILWVALVIVSIVFSQTYSTISSTLLGVGTAIFIVGFLIRYPPYLIRRRLLKYRGSRGFLERYNSAWSSLGLQTNDRDLYGPWLEIIGITIIAKSYIGIIPAMVLFPIILGSAIIYKYKKLAILNPHTEFPSAKDFVPKSANVFSIILVPMVVGILVGVISREFTIFHANIETARSVLFTLSQIEGSIGVLAITVIFVLSQLTASNYSVRVSSILFRQRSFWIPLSIVFVSITYNLLTVANSSLSFPTTAGDFYSLRIDISYVFALATVCGIFYFIYKALKMVTPESIITDALKNFNKDWLEQIKIDWSNPASQLTPKINDDPFIIIERVLSKAVDSGDTSTFFSGLLHIQKHIRSSITIDPRIFPDYIIEIDAYLCHHFHYIVHTAAKNNDIHTLLRLINFIEELGNPSLEAIKKSNPYIFSLYGAPGELLLREIIQQSISHKLVECVYRGVRIITTRSTGVIKTLPKQSDTWLYNNMKPLSVITTEEQNKLYDNDHKIQNFESQYLLYLEAIGIQAIDLNFIPAFKYIYSSLTQVISIVLQNVDGNNTKSMMVMRACFCLDSLSKLVLGKRLSRAIDLAYLKYAIEQLNPEDDEDIAWYLVRYVSGVVVEFAKHGILDRSDVEESAMIGLQVIKKFTKPCLHLVDSFDEAAKLTRNRPEYLVNKDLQLVYLDIIQRIKQIGQSGNASNAEQIRSKANSVLKSLGELELQ